MAVIGGFCFLLLILYQCLKAGMFFKTDPPDRPDEKGYVELGETYESDDDFVGPSSKATSRRSSFNTSGSKSDGELALGDSASVYGYPKSSDGEYSPVVATRALSAYGEEGTELVSTAGRIQVSASYAPTAEKLAVSVIRAEDVPSKQRGGAANVQVRVVLLPSKRQRFKTKAKASANPNFHENFTFSRVTQGETHECGLRFRLYGHERVGRDKLIGEVNISLTEFDLDGDGTPLWRTLTPRSNLSVSTMKIVCNLLRPARERCTRIFDYTVRLLLVVRVQSSLLNNKWINSVSCFSFRRRVFWNASRGKLLIIWIYFLRSRHRATNWPVTNSERGSQLSLLLTRSYECLDWGSSRSFCFMPERTCSYSVPMFSLANLQNQKCKSSTLPSNSQSDRCVGGI